MEKEKPKKKEKNRVTQHNSHRLIQKQIIFMNQTGKEIGYLGNAPQRRFQTKQSGREWESWEKIVEADEKEKEKEEEGLPSLWQ